MCSRPLYGLIQHSFALQLPERSKPFRGRTNLERLSDRFETGDFRVQSIGEAHHPNPDHSPLARAQLTTLQSLEPVYVCPDDSPTRLRLPEVFRWAEWGNGEDRDAYEEPKLIFADEYDHQGYFSPSDFLVSKGERGDDGESISQLFLELMAHKRSRLFGFRLANRFVNVTLPYATIEPVDPNTGHAPSQTGAWFVQPLLSFIRGGRVRSRLRPTYSLTLFLAPVTRRGGSFSHRPASIPEIAGIANPGWGFAAFLPEGLGDFKVSGKLIDYLSQLSGFNLKSMLDLPGETATLRALVETIAFGAGLGIAQKETDLATVRRIGNDVVMSLGSARVSSVVVSDPMLERKKVKKSIRQLPFPGKLAELLSVLAGTLRIPEPGDEKAYKCRLDRPNVDNDIYAVGVLPTKRIMVVTSCAEAQYGTRESALMQAGSVAYMTLGAATAIGTMRDIDRRLERLEGANDPLRIARIDAEVAADLGEIYDLDITRESYREMYRRLRVRLGIARDYKTLRDRMEMLYRATSTIHEHKAERRLEWLTAAIVALSLLILIGTVVLAGRG